MTPRRGLWKSETFLPPTSRSERTGRERALTTLPGRLTGPPSPSVHRSLPSLTSVGGVPQSQCPSTSKYLPRCLLPQIVLSGFQRLTQ